MSAMVRKPWRPACGASVASARAEPLGTHVAPWAPTGEVVEAGTVRLEYTVVAHIGAAVGVAPGLELRVGAGALIPPVQLYEADAALRGQLVRAGALRVTVGAQAMALYRQLIQTIVSNSEDVGNSFAEEARKIHYNEAPERPIRGKATPDECDALRDEGIQILHLPEMKEEDLN